MPRDPWIFKYRAPDGSPDLTTTRGVIGIYAFIGLLLFLAIAASLSALLKWRSNGAVSLEPSRGWLDVLDVASSLVLIWNGLSIGGMIGKRATPSSALADVAARQVSGVPAEPPAVPGKTIPRNSAQTQAVGADVPLTDVAAIMNRQPSKTDDES